jgi:hypothetical protein
MNYVTNCYESDKDSRISVCVCGLNLCIEACGLKLCGAHFCSANACGIN